MRRIADILFAAFALPLAAPAILFFSLLVFLEDPGNPFFLQERVGKDGRIFRLVKIRTMRKKSGGPPLTMRNDPRVLRVGRFLRKHHLDELPNLINLLLGHVTLVGPRPDSVEVFERFRREIPGYERRIRVKPGLFSLDRALPPIQEEDEKKLFEKKLERDLAMVDGRSSLSAPVIILRGIINGVLRGGGR